MERKKKQSSLLNFVQRKKTNVDGQDESSVNESTDEQLDEIQDVNITEATTSDSPKVVNPVSSIKNVCSLTKPNQPGESFKFPSRTFGDRERSFQSSWFSKHTWLHYDEETDKAFCFICMKASQNNALRNVPSNSDAFVKEGYCNWKKALGTKVTNSKKNTGFPLHENSDIHREAVARYIVAPSSAVGDIIDMTSSAYSAERYHNRKMFLKVVSNIRHLARQGNPLRGNWDSDAGAERNSNFYQLMLLRAEDDPDVYDWLTKKKKFMSPQVQNEIIEILATEVREDISRSIQKAIYFTIMADETADVSNKEQVAVCIRWVDVDLCVHEEFVGIKPVARATADEILNVISQTLTEMNLKLEDARGQCYDGASTMSGNKTGVSTRIKEINPKCLFTHCYGHVLNLSVKDACTGVKCLKETFETASEICKLVKKSPQRDTHLKSLREETENEDAGVHAFCPTRWTVRGRTLAALLNNHHELSNLWAWSLSILKDTEMKGRVIGVQTMMKTFNFLFGCITGKLTLNHTDNLSKTLQNPKLSALEAQTISKDTVTVLKNERSEKSFDLFWELVLAYQKRLDVEEPVLPRQRKMPARYDEARDTYQYPDTKKEHYRCIYYESLDVLVNVIAERFDQPDYQIYLKMQELLIKGFRNNGNIDEEILGISELYFGDIDIDTLRAQLKLLPSIAQRYDFDQDKMNIMDIIRFMQSLSSADRGFVSEVVMIVKLVLLAPATNAVSERSFSALKRLKTYMRATMADQRLANLMLLHIHRDKCDKLSLVDVANKFVGDNDSRRKMFGNFTTRDIDSKKEFRSVAIQTDSEVKK